MSAYSQCFWKNSFLISNDALNTQLKLINNSNELTKAFRFSNQLNYKYSLKLPNLNHMSCISIWSYQESNTIHDVPRQTSQNSEGLKSNGYQQWRNLLGMQETFRWFKQEKRVYVAASAECLFPVLFLAQELLSFM